MANEYSRITEIRLHNFMPHSDTVLTFDDSNIIDLCGYNDSGKSAIKWALDVLLYDGSPTLQASYIKEGESYFQVELRFEDGVSISKTKDNQGKSVWIMSKDGVVIYTNKKETNIIATDGVPQEIAKYLGVIFDEITEQKLNIRTKTDKALLTETTGGENYKIFSTICNSEVLAEASKAMTERKNKLNQDISNKATTVTAYHNQFLSLDAPNDAVLDDLHKQTEICRGIDDRSKAITNVLGVREALQAVVIPEEIDNAGVLKELDNIKAINDILELKAKGDALDVYPELARYDSIQLQLIQKCKELSESIEAVAITPELKGYDSKIVVDIVDVINQYNKYSHQYRDYMGIEQQYSQFKDELESLCKQNNIRVCKNCGTAITGGDEHEHV